MLKIKLAHFGKRKQPHFRIVVNEARDKRDGQYLALLGQYAPTQVPKILNVDVAAYHDWIKKGAQPTETVAAIVRRFESGTPFPEKKPQLSKKAKAKAAQAKEAAANPEPAKTVEPAATPEAVTAPEPETPAPAKVEEAVKVEEAAKTEPVKAE